MDPDENGNISGEGFDSVEISELQKLLKEQIKQREKYDMEQVCNFQRTRFRYHQNIKENTGILYQLSILYLNLKKAICLRLKSFQ
jgi:hypothetical protein